MDLYERKTKEIDFGEHGCPGVKVLIRQLPKGDVLRLRQLRIAPVLKIEPEATQAEIDSAKASHEAALEKRAEGLMEIMNAHVLGISGLQAGDEAIDTMAKLMDVADSPDVVLGTLDPLITGITTEIFAVSSMSAADLGNSQPLSDSGHSGSDGTAPSAS